jgi:hypothetical protein
MSNKIGGFMSGRLKKTSLNMLVWPRRDNKTLLQTIEGYNNAGLFDVVTEKNLFINEYSDTDSATSDSFLRKIKKIHSFDKIILSTINVGVGQAFSTLAKISNAEQLLILEDDWQILENSPNLFSILADCEHALHEKVFDYIRLKHASRPGVPNYSEQFRGDELGRGIKYLIDSVHSYGERCAELFPEHLRLLQINTSRFIVSDSAYGNHTNQAFMCRRDFFLSEITPFSGTGIELERNIGDTWRLKGYKVAHNVPGLFTHCRFV